MESKVLRLQNEGLHTIGHDPEDGFSFEYSATFGQAMKASGNKTLEQEYAKCILFDYSYKYFYRDGFGKDYRILNLADDRDTEVRRLYLTACLLAFYQQLVLFEEDQPDFRPFLLSQCHHVNPTQATLAAAKLVEVSAQTRWQPLMLAVDFKGATVTRQEAARSDTPAA